MLSIKLSLAMTMALLAVSTGAAAGQLDYDLYTGVLYTDNINLTAARPIGQSVLIPGISFNWNQHGKDLQAHASGSVEYRDYLGSRFGNQTAVQLASQALWTLSPDRLDLAVQDYAGLQPLNTQASDAPGNRQQTNVFTVGPVLHFRLGNNLRGQAELRYIDTYAEKTSVFDSRRTQVALSAMRDLSPTSQLSLNMDAQHVDLYRDQIDPNYDRGELFAHYMSKLAHLDFDLQLGTTRINYDKGANRSQSGPLTRVKVSWVPSSRSTVSLSGRREYSDAAEDMMLRPGVDTFGPSYVISTGDTTVSPQVFLQRTAELSYAFSGERLGFTLTPFFRKLGYAGSNTQYDQTARGGYMDLHYRLRPTLTVSAFANRENLRFDTVQRLDKNLTTGLELIGQRTSHWSWRAALTYQRRTSTEVGQGYRTTTIYLGVMYKR